MPDADAIKIKNFFTIFTVHQPEKRDGVVA